MTKPVPSSLLTAALLSVVALTTLPPAQAASYTWTNTAGGNWNVAANWSPNGVPGGTDSAAITVTGGYTVTINDTESAGTLTLGASSGDGTVQTLNVSASTFTMNNASTGTAQGTLSVTGGTLAGTGALAIAGPLNWTGGAISSVVQFNGGSINGGLNLYGALINSGTLDWSGNLYMYGGVLTNLGTINLASGTSVSAESGSPVLNNDGQFNVSGSGASPIDIPFNNYGTVSVETGTLELLDGGTESNSFTVASGASLELDSGNTITFGSGATISGAGNFTISGGTADFLGSANVTSILNLAGGTLNFSGSVPITPVSATITGGTEEGSQTLQITNSGGFTWTGGAVAGMVEFNGGSVNGGLNLFGALINSGTLDWNGNLYMYGGVLTNLGTINVASGTSVSPENGSPDLQNDGQFNVAGPGTSIIGIPFYNQGTVTVNGGTLQLTGGGTESDPFTVVSGASLELSGAAVNFNSGASISGAGNFIVGGGTANFSGSANVTTALTVSGGALDIAGNNPMTPVSATISGGTEEGSQTLQITNSGGFTWTGGAVAGMVEFNGGSVNGGLNLFGALINSGTLDWNGNLYMYGGVLTNLGTINVASGTSVSPENGSPDLQNDGQFNVPGPGTSTIGIPFYNQGAVTVGGGTLQLTGGGTESNSFTVASGASLELSGAAVNFNSGASISGAGNFIVGGGTANFSGSANVTTALNLTGGTLNVNGSGPITPASFSITGGTEQGAQALQVQSAGSFAWTGGGISGTVLFNGGTINGDLNLFGALVNSGTLALTGSLYMYGGVITNQGTINLAAASSMTRENGAPDIENTGQFNVSGPGTSTIGIPFINGGTLNIPSGTLAATGGFASTNGTLQFGISNTANFGTLTLSGNLAVNGTLNAIANGYAPKTGDTFPLITYGSESGLFTGFNLPPNVDWQVDYGATAFSLIVSGLNAPYLTLQAISPPEVPDGFTLLMLGPIGSNYSIQASSDPELRDWISLTNFTTVDTSFYYTDTSIATNAARVFRAMIR